MRTKQQFIAEWMESDPTGSARVGERTREFFGIPLLAPFRDMDYYYLARPISWRPEYQSDPGNVLQIEVPEGFVTDLASIPRLFWAWMPPTGRYGLAAIVHDYLYWEQRPYKRREADALFGHGMEELGVSTFKRSIIGLALRTLGWSAWRRNAALKAKGEKRLLRKFPRDPRITWQEWKLRPGVFGEGSENEL